MTFNREIKNVTIEVLKDTVTNKSLEILITDNNQDYYSWGVDFRIQQKLNIEKYYGELPNGTYRVVKSVYDKGYVDIYSDEFEIK